ncbi:hypothetical protein [Mycoplasmopsis cynos]|nr:hypothetical protein [Mycoplasmopsis cynos]UWV81549.1 hypothetical protein NW065_06625 [Mycoplasmopsis cynos]UWV92301.1 hypothetical protein NWE57_05510 [Mycoplasmopsis cynos]WAM07754.1 hypothetical protein ONA21_06625 [Mycoplasmopsis cynos]WAM10443.1 hypothetical protein ONA00_03440 [Mycoplasmopsis cynos]
MKKLDYDYLQFIKDLKQNPFLDNNELSRLDLNIIGSIKHQV